MTEIVRSRRIPKPALLAAATALALGGCTGGNQAPNPSETPRRGDDAIVKQFREVAQKALHLYDHPPKGAAHIENEQLLDLPYTAIFDAQRGWELHLASYSRYDATNPIPDGLRQVAIYTGSDLPSVNGDKTEAGMSASINSTSDAIGTSVEVKGAPFKNGTPTHIIAVANSKNDPPGKRELDTASGTVLCEEAYSANPNQQMFDTLNRALDAISQEEAPVIALPQVPFLDTGSVHGVCPQ